MFCKFVHFLWLKKRGSHSKKTLCRECQGSEDWLEKMNSDAPSTPEISCITEHPRFHAAGCFPGFPENNLNPDGRPSVCG
mgnify:CR=1 FL=1